MGHFLTIYQEYSRHSHYPSWKIPRILGFSGWAYLSTTTHFPLLNHNVFFLKTHRKWAVFFREPIYKAAARRNVHGWNSFSREVFCQDRNRVIVICCLESAEAKVFPTRRVAMIWLTRIFQVKFCEKVKFVLYGHRPKLDFFMARCVANMFL